MYYVIGGLTVVLVTLFIRDAPGFDPLHKNSLDVIVRVRQGSLAKTQSFLPDLRRNNNRPPPRLL